jgi:hypothetical protein
MFMGIAAEGIKREISATLESVALCRENRVKALAIPNTAILKLAALLTETRNLPVAKASALLFPSRNQYYPLRKDIVNGILPFLPDLIQRETMSHATGFDTFPDFSIDPREQFAFDPAGNDYYCKLCHSEIANQYYQCLGCLQHINHEFNICYNCYEAEKYMNQVFMMPTTQEDNFQHLEYPERHHALPPPGMEKCTEECRLNDLCDFCCHVKFQRHLRFYEDDFVSKLINIGDEVLVGDPVGDSDGISFPDAAPVMDAEMDDDEPQLDEAEPVVLDLAVVDAEVVDAEVVDAELGAEELGATDS